MTLFSHEPIQFRVVVVVGSAFIALMVIEGLRASFMPRRTHSDALPVTKPSRPAVPPPVVEPPQTSASTKVFAAAPGVVAPHRYAPARNAAHRNRKRQVTRPRAHRNMLPKIRRMVTANETDLRRD